MAFVLQNVSDLILCKEARIIKFNTATKEERNAIIPPEVVSEGPKNAPAQNETSVITTACVSPDGRYLAVSTQRKQVVVYDSSFDVIKNFSLLRGASKVRFTQDNDILVADKTGDAYLYELTDEENAPRLILGHLSMLLDILLTKCGKYVITCDRDEKIRVSRFPNAYNIVSFCLGHREFVTNVDLIGEDVLVSASGDGTVRFWDYLSGRELHGVTTGDHIEDKKVIARFCTDMDKEKCEVSCLPITNMQVFKGKKTYVAVSLLNYAIQLYSVDKINGAVETKFLQFIECDSSLVRFSLGADLFVLLNERIWWYREGVDEFNLVGSEGDAALNDFYGRNAIKLSEPEGNNDVSLLYKRKFDNVQEYLVRKKLRLQIK